MYIWAFSHKKSGIHDKADKLLYSESDNKPQKPVFGIFGPLLTCSISKQK